jgi:hypothetical protein
MYGEEEIAIHISVRGFPSLLATFKLNWRPLPPTGQFLSREAKSERLHATNYPFVHRIPELDSPPFSIRLLL